MFPINNRLSLPSDFYKVKKFGKRISNIYFSVNYLKDNSLTNSFYSVIVSKFIAKKASQRNLLKRKTKALIIKNRNNLPNNIKCIIYPKPTVNSIKSRELEVEFLKLFGEIK